MSRGEEKSAAGFSRHAVAHIALKSLTLLALIASPASPSQVRKFDHTGIFRLVIRRQTGKGGPPYLCRMDDPYHVVAVEIHNPASSAFASVNDMRAMVSASGRSAHMPASPYCIPDEIARWMWRCMAAFSNGRHSEDASAAPSQPPSAPGSWICRSVGASSITFHFRNSPACD